MLDAVPVAGSVGQLLARARQFAVQGRDSEAKLAYIDLLQIDPANCAALLELGALAQASGHISAARTAFLQAVLEHPENAVAQVCLANQLREDGALEGAKIHYLAALEADALLAEAHQGLARVFEALGANAAATPHWRLGFAGNAVTAARFRGIGNGVPVLLLVAARGGNIPMRLWVDELNFAVTAIYADFYDPAQALPPHALIVNAIGDADLCDAALAGAELIVARGSAPVINLPSRVRQTGRAANARRLGHISGVVAPVIRRFKLPRILASEGLGFPLLLRAPGYHTGEHFVRVATEDELARAISAMPGDEVLAIEYLDARGTDGMSRKYRVMFIDGVAYPLHLAISADWKVHYFSGAMAECAAYREEEQRFLEDMQGVLGQTAMAALGGICQALGLDYAGIDFAVDQDGCLLLFEANATMVIVPPDDNPIWDYRRPAINRVLEARRQMLWRRIELAKVS